jgi:nitrate reductase gamma subunit
MFSTAFHVVVGIVLPYLALLVFFAGVSYRLLVWKRLPQPSPMTLYPTQGSGWGSLIKEALFFPSLQRSDRWLWALAWVFHAALALAFLGHLRVLSGLLDRALAALGIGPGALAALSTFAGTAAGIVLLVAITGLIARRLVVRRVREISTVPDFVALFLLTAVITTGDLMRWLGPPVDLGSVRAWIASLATLSPQAPAHPLLLLHLSCAELLILYIAFSKLMHFGGFFFTFSLTKGVQS